VDVRFRPLPVWPYPVTAHRRSRSTFKAAWADTVELLGYELDRLNASEVVVGCGLREADIRLDGWPRATAQAPTHPGVEVSFDSTRGRLVYATDVCEWWQHNVRAVGLGLEALRAVDRHGITRSGEQYAGFRAIGATAHPEPTESLVERGHRLIAEHGSEREALRRTHPDGGGDRADFEAVIAARRAAAA